MKTLRRAAAATLIALSGPMAVPPVLTACAETTAAKSLPSGDFVRKAKRLSGRYDVFVRDGRTVIRFSDDFRAAGGPDLKVFLSPKTVAEVTGKTATDGALHLGDLASTRGAQEYILPEGVDLDDFASVLVHCEPYAVLWGGSDL